MPPSKKFTRQQLRTAALVLVDENGLAGLNMRSLAAALGTGAMTIYNYVDGRDGLDALLVEAVMAEVEWSSTETDDWATELRTISEAVWRTVRSHPHVIPLLLTRRSMDPIALEPAEATLRALARSGRAGKELLVAFRAVSGFIMGFAQAELTGPLALAHDEQAGSITARMRALPTANYPNLVEIATAADGIAPESEFHSGLDIILAGLGA